MLLEISQYLENYLIPYCSEVHCIALFFVCLSLLSSPPPHNHRSSLIVFPERYQSSSTRLDPSCLAEMNKECMSLGWLEYLC